jgi:CDP-glucose 4,6-dehydratase
MGDLVSGYLDIFKDKKVLITGDTGFKGSWLAFWLHILGAEVYGFALPPKHPNDHFNLLGLEKSIHHIDSDINNYPQIQKFVTAIEPEFVFHLAAQPLVRKSYDEPKLTFDTNVGGTINLLESVRHCPSIRALVLITSDKCYRNKEWYWGYREIDELGGKDPYSASKAAAELVFAGYENSFFEKRPRFGAASARAGNVIGGGDWSADRIVPDCIRAIKNDHPIQLRNPSATRPWQHVLEPLSGYLLLASQLYKDPKTFRGSYNFGPADSKMHTVKDLAEELVSVWGKGEIRTVQKADEPPEAGVLHLNCDKAHQKLNWYPKWNFKRTIELTANWYKMVTDDESARTITTNQINEYMGCEL